MATATERIPVLVTRQEKRRITQQANEAGMSVGEFLRRAAMAFQPAEDEKILSAMIDQMLKTSAQASAAIDSTLAYVEDSNRRIAALDLARSTEGQWE